MELHRVQAPRGIIDDWCTPSVMTVLMGCTFEQAWGKLVEIHREKGDTVFSAVDGRPVDQYFLEVLQREGYKLGEWLEFIKKPLISNLPKVLKKNKTYLVRLEEVGTDEAHWMAYRNGKCYDNGGHASPVSDYWLTRWGMNYRADSFVEVKH